MCVYCVYIVVARLLKTIKYLINNLYVNERRHDYLYEGGHVQEIIFRLKVVGPSYEEVAKLLGDHISTSLEQPHTATSATGKLGKYDFRIDDVADLGVFIELKSSAANKSDDSVTTDMRAQLRKLGIKGVASKVPYEEQLKALQRRGQRKCLRDKKPPLSLRAA